MNTAYYQDQPAIDGDDYEEPPSDVGQQSVNDGYLEPTPIVGQHSIDAGYQVTQPRRLTTTHYEDLDKKGMDKYHEYQSIRGKKVTQSSDYLIAWKKKDKNPVHRKIMPLRIAVACTIQSERKRNRPLYTMAVGCQIRAYNHGTKMLTHFFLI